MNQPRPTHAQLAALIGIPADTIMIVTINDDHIKITTNDFKFYGLPLPLPPMVTDTAAGSAHSVTTAPRPPADPDDLTRLTGIGPVTAERLQAAGIISFTQLAEAETAVIRQITNAHASQIKKWQKEAKEAIK